MVRKKDLAHVCGLTTGKARLVRDGCQLDRVRGELVTQ